MGEKEAKELEKILRKKFFYYKRKKGGSVSFKKTSLHSLHQEIQKNYSTILRQKKAPIIF